MNKPKTAPTAQVPAAGEVFLDHVGWMVPDIDAASLVFERLGFPLTPFSIHGDRDPKSGQLKPVGTANRLAMLALGYLEILTPVDGADTPVRRHMQASIARHTGAHLIAFTTADATAEAQRMASAGLELQPPVNLRRRIEGEDGGEVEVAFTVIRAAFEEFPEARVQMLTHHTPEHMWQRRYIATENAILGLAEATFLVADPAEAAQRFARFVGRAVTPGEHPTIRLDRGLVRFVDERGAAQRFGRVNEPPIPSLAAITLTSRDLGRTRDFLLSQGFRPGAIEPGHLLIDQAEALGAHLVVIAA